MRSPPGQNGNNRYLTSQRCLDLDTHTVVLIVNSPFAVHLGEPFVTDHDDHDRANLDRLVYLRTKVVAKPDCFDVHENTFLSEVIYQAIRDSSSHVRRVFAAIANKNATERNLRAGLTHFSLPGLGLGTRCFMKLCFIMAVKPARLRRRALTGENRTPADVSSVPLPKKRSKHAIF
jgi:hypothetical protein